MSRIDGFQLRAGGIVCAVFVAVTVAYYGVIASATRAATQVIQKQMAEVISVDGIYIALPGVVVVRNLSIRASDGTPAAVFPWSFFRIAPVASLLSGRVAVSDGIIYGGRVYDHAVGISFFSAIQKILAAGAPPVTGRMLMRIVDGRLYAFSSPEQWVAVNGIVHARGTTFTGYAQGYLSAAGTGAFSWGVVEAILQGRVTDDGVLFDRVTLRSPRVSARLWGQYDGARDLWLRGAIVARSSVPEESLVMRVGAAVSYRQKMYTAIICGILPAVMDVAEPDMYLLDLDSRVQILSSSVEVVYADATYNTVPVHLRGVLGFDDGVRYVLSASVYPARMRSSRLAAVSQCDLSLKGSLRQTTLLTNGSLEVHFSDDVPVQRARVQFTGATTELLRYPVVQTLVESGAVSVRSGGRTYQVFFSSPVTMTVDLSAPQHRQVRFGGTVFGGAVRGIADIDHSTGRPQLSADIDLQSLQVHALREVFPTFRGIDGRGSAHLQVRSHPRALIRGALSVVDGRMQGLDFLTWFSSYFNVPSMTSVAFRELSSGFIATSQGITWHDVVMDGSAVSLRGSFDLRTSGHVTSVFSVSFARELLAESEYFRPLLKNIGGERAMFDFDFKLSGALDALNFQWLQSDFKQQIRDRIPDFIERRIERTISGE